ncbi:MULTISPECIES: DUF2064 domain-containing protein [Cryobacterium]|uniref:DUF2064 domain-containing protein n=1 Tax=Cryobacterium breve TaxID=1259258 RepID=A0ABY2IY27_9MICO|nr:MULTISPECIES: DUF2064 domain-containing protein [Cryobacterium]TFC96786.1 DUF2064 domain-containing protein [Cryobacterium sp. TmT3-12]TFC97417.1 DUF2064 domain-containing protein [Cryobacterium breve]
MTTLVVIAKECLPGRVKTRLHPALTYEQAAELAAASLDDTLAVALALPANRRILAFDGVIPPPAAADFEIVPQISGTLDERLSAIFDSLSDSVLLIGMDTPQLTADLLDPVFTEWDDSTDAWFGAAHDGGFWALALGKPTPGLQRGHLIRGVPMSRPDTGDRQLARLRNAGLRVRHLPLLTDVDTIEDADAVARVAPHSRFAATFLAMRLEEPDIE